MNAVSPPPDYMPVAERQRLGAQRDVPEDWRLLGPYLAERPRGTVREDYTADGEGRGRFTHDQARAPHRWNEDGLGGVCDAKQYLCFVPALSDGRDPMLRERAFGMDGAPRQPRHAPLPKRHRGLERHRRRQEAGADR
jgi:hypothetical protein